MKHIGSKAIILISVLAVLLNTSCSLQFGHPSTSSSKVSTSDKENVTLTKYSDFSVSVKVAESGTYTIYKSPTDKTDSSSGAVIVGTSFISSSSSYGYDIPAGTITEGYPYIIVSDGKLQWVFKINFESMNLVTYSIAGSFKYDTTSSSTAKIYYSSPTSSYNTEYKLIRKSDGKVIEMNTSYPDTDLLREEFYVKRTIGAFSYTDKSGYVLWRSSGIPDSNTY